MLAEVPGRPRLVALLLHGGGLRLMEAVSRRVKDVDLDRRELTVRHGKGGRDRVTMIPESIVSELTAQVQRVKLLHLCSAGGSATRRGLKTGDLSHVSALVRDASTGGRLRHSDRRGTSLTRSPNQDTQRGARCLGGIWA